MSKPTKPAPPTGLNSAGKSLWSSITGKYDLRPDEVTILGLACAARDRIVAMEEERDGRVTALGSTGQLVAHPLIAEVRQTEAQVSSLLAKLKLPDEGASAPQVNPQREGGMTRWQNAHGKGA